MQPMYYIGLDVHKRKISYCVKDSSGKIYAEGWIPATRFDLDRWMKTLPQPWSAALEATMFSGWIYDHLKPHAAELNVAHPLTLWAIAAAKKKNDRIDANKTCDCLRCDFLPECYMMPTAIRERRRTLRYRNLLVRQMVQMKIKTSTLLMEAGVSYNKHKLHKAGYFRELLATNPFALPAVSVPGDGGAARQNGKCHDPLPAARSIADGTCRASDEHSGDWADHSADVGLGNRRGAAYFVHQEGHQLLRAMRR
jgi:hypothetical protein